MSVAARPCPAVRRAGADGARAPRPRGGAGDRDAAAEVRPRRRRSRGEAPTAAEHHLRADRQPPPAPPPAGRLLHPADLEGKPLPAGRGEPEGGAGHRPVHARHGGAARPRPIPSIRSRRFPPRPHYLRDLADRFGNLGLAAAAYNAGEKRVTDWRAGIGGLPYETRDYVAVDHRPDRRGLERAGSRIDAAGRGLPPDETPAGHLPRRRGAARQARRRDGGRSPTIPRPTGRHGACRSPATSRSTAPWRATPRCRSAMPRSSAGSRRWWSAGSTGAAAARPLFQLRVPAADARRGRRHLRAAQGRRRRLPRAEDRGVGDPPALTRSPAAVIVRVSGNGGGIMQAVTRTARRIPVLGFGTWKLTGESCAACRRRGAPHRLPSHRRRRRLWQRGLRVGEGLRASGVPRDDIFITTKVPPEELDDRRLPALRRSQPRAAWHRSGRPVLIHWPSKTLPIADHHRLAQQGQGARRDPPHRLSRISPRRCSARPGRRPMRRWSPTSANTTPISARTG